MLILCACYNAHCTQYMLNIIHSMLVHHHSFFFFFSLCCFFVHSSFLPLCLMISQRLYSSRTLRTRSKTWPNKECKRLSPSRRGEHGNAPPAATATAIEKSPINRSDLIYWLNWRQSLSMAKVVLFWYYLRLIFAVI